MHDYCAQLLWSYLARGWSFAVQGLGVPRSIAEEADAELSQHSCTRCCPHVQRSWMHKKGAHCKVNQRQKEVLLCLERVVYNRSSSVNEKTNTCLKHLEDKLPKGNWDYRCTLFHSLLRNDSKKKGRADNGNHTVPFIFHWPHWFISRDNGRFHIHKANTANQMVHAVYTRI